jgi:hypothetical protein
LRYPLTVVIGCVPPDQRRDFSKIAHSEPSTVNGHEFGPHWWILRTVDEQIRPAANMTIDWNGSCLADNTRADRSYLKKGAILATPLSYK